MNRVSMSSLLVALLALARPVAAHEFWIAPSRYGAVRGSTIELGAVAGTGFRGEKKPWSPDHAVRFTLRTAKSINLTRGATPGEVTWTRFDPTDGGGAMAAFESDFLPIQLPAAQFDDYLKVEGLGGPLAARQGAPRPAASVIAAAPRPGSRARMPARATAVVGCRSSWCRRARPERAPRCACTCCGRAVHSPARSSRRGGPRSLPRARRALCSSATR
jgi:hypothetical protein